MTNHFFRKLLATFSLLGVVTYGVVSACGGGDWDWDWWRGNSSFSPESYVDKSYSPLFFSRGEVFYGVGFDTKHNSRFNEDIVKDWSSYLKNKISTTDLEYFLLNAEAETALSELYKASVDKKDVAEWKNKLDIKDPKVKEFFTFMNYAKQVETGSISHYDYWDYENRDKTYLSWDLAQSLEKKYNTVKDSFLKNRYWFQTMKAYFYGDNPAEAIYFFENTKEKEPKNVLYYRALSYVAGVHYQNKDYTTANYLYSIVFDKCPEMRVVTAYNFHPQNQTDFNASLQIAKDTNEKAALWALLGYYADERTAIKEIFKIDPKSSHLDYLLTRLINKEESRLSDISFTNTVKYREDIKKRLDKESYALVSSIAKSQKTGKPYLWNIAAGYLETYNGNFRAAADYFKISESQIPNTALAKDQLRLLKLINTVSEMNAITVKDEQKLLPELQWLYFTLPNDVNAEASQFRYHQASAWSKKYIASLYNAKKNSVFSELFNRDNRFYANSKQLENMKTFLAKKDKTAWEQLAQNIYTVKLADIYEFQAITSTYNNKIDEAVAFMEKAENLKNTELYGNPFNGGIKDCHDCDHRAPQRIKYSKLNFLKKVKEMQDKVNSGEDVYNNSILLGNAFYNITHYGNARVFYEANIMAEDSSSPYVLEYNQKILLNCSIADMYYKKAFDAATTAEQKARCTYMRAKCERNTFYNQSGYKRYDYIRDRVLFKAWDGFKKLEKEYSNTRYYQQVINECGYFRKYLKME